jgi:CheY-like chemotaxis protein
MAKKLSCLLVDDDEDDREIFIIALNDLGPNIDCELACDGMDALEKLRSTDSLPDFIFIDLNMPRMNGKECISEIKKDNRLLGIPVIIYSTSSSPHDQQDARRLGAAYFFTKPPSISALSNALRDIFVGSTALQAG